MLEVVGLIVDNTILFTLASGILGFQVLYRLYVGGRWIDCNMILFTLASGILGFQVLYRL
jgi:flagellar assembly factor FliW